MRVNSDQQWVILTCVADRNSIKVNYQDGRGRIVNETGSQTRKIGRYSIPSIAFAYLRDFVVEELADVTALFQHNKPSALDIYIDTPIHPEYIDIENELRHIITSQVLDDRAIGFMRLLQPHPSHGMRRPFTLPFNINFSVPTMDRILNRIKQSGWYSKNPNVDSHGVHFWALENDEVYLEEDLDLLMFHEDDISNWEKVVTAVSNDTPRVVVSIESAEYPSKQVIKISKLIHSPWLYILESGGCDYFLEEFLYQIINDVPLSKAVFSARAKFPDIRCIFASAPYLNQTLRISEAATSFQNQVSEYCRTISPGNNPSFFEHLTEEGIIDVSGIWNAELPVSPDSGDRSDLPQISVGFDLPDPPDMFGMSGKSSMPDFPDIPNRPDLPSMPDIPNMPDDPGFPGVPGMSGIPDYSANNFNYFQHIRNYTINTSPGTSGLGSLSSETRQFQANQPYFQQIQSKLQEAVDKPEFYNAVRKEQNRKVDVTLDLQVDEVTFSPVNRHQFLLPQLVYRLNVEIGQLSENSLISGETEPIDPLLPDPSGAKGHWVEVVVFPKDFDLLSVSRQTLYLPLLGGSEPVHFTIQAPGTVGKAALRIALFHNNILLQAFNFEAWVGEYPGKTSPLIKVSLDLSNTKKFSNLDALPKRSLYLGINSSNDGTHTLFVKKDDVVRQIGGLNETIIKKAQADFEKLLRDTYFDETGQIRYLLVVPPTAALRSEFEEQVRRFARLGNKYYNAIFTDNDRELQKAMYGIRDLSGLDITIGRHQINYSFPWPLLYDYSLPDIFDTRLHPICSGETLNSADYPDSVRQDNHGCQHNPGLYTYCIDGFWGVRHRIEQLFPKEHPSDASLELKFSKDQEIYFCFNVVDSYVTALIQDLKAYPVKIITTECDWLELLWDCQTRPVIMVVLGHMEEINHNGETIQRILTFPREQWDNDKQGGPIPHKKWIYHDLLINKIKDYRYWDHEPYPLVLLVNCNSAGIQMDSLYSLVRDFYNAGATGVIGTECNINTDLGVRFVRDVLDGIYNRGETLGEAIRMFNRNLFLSQIPLAFAFTCFGNNNLIIKR